MVKPRNVIGVDPSSSAHGVAWYQDGKLVELYNAKLFPLMDWLENLEYPYLSIENVMQTKGVFTKNEQANKYAHAKVSNNVGMCQQAYIELIRGLEHKQIDYEVHKPASNWKDNGDVYLFKKITGWDKRSNKDTRSAAYFGWLALS